MAITTYRSPSQMLTCIIPCGSNFAALALLRVAPLAPSRRTSCMKCYLQAAKSSSTTTVLPARPRPLDQSRLNLCCTAILSLLINGVVLVDPPVLADKQLSPTTRRGRCQLDCHGAHQLLQAPLLRSKMRTQTVYRSKVFTVLLGVLGPCSLGAPPRLALVAPQVVAQRPVTSLPLTSTWHGLQRAPLVTWLLDSVMIELIQLGPVCST
jgi:hypothetical protein